MLSINFKDGGHLGLLIRTILAIFDVHSNASYQVSSPLAFWFRRRSKNSFSRWRPWPPAWIADRNDFSYFCPTRHPDDSYQVSKQLAFLFRRRSELDFQDSSHGGHPGFPIGTSLAIFDLQVTLMLPAKFQVKCHFGSGEEAKNRFSRWPQRNDFSYF